METKELKQYTGTKTVKAMPMTLGEAEQVLNRHIDTSAVENREQVPGYLVEYGEDGDNYRSWSPKEVFERAYRPSETYLDRMLIEYDQLKDRIMKLQAFYLTIGTEYMDMPFNPMIEHATLKCQFDFMLERSRLKSQLDNMMAYAKNLGDRIRYAQDKLKEIERTKAEFERKQQAAEAARLQMQSLVGFTVVEAGRCDSCPSEPTNCKKLQLADGSYICLKDFTKEDCDCNPCPPHQEQDANTQDLTGGGPTPIL